MMPVVLIVLIQLLNMLITARMTLQMTLRTRKLFYHKYE